MGMGELSLSSCLPINPPDLTKIRNEWTRMFPSRNLDIGSNLPIIAAMADGEPGVSTVSESKLMGGWKKNDVVAKQYIKSVVGNVDLDLFAN
jgi:hypothetical protein